MVCRHHHEAWEYTDRLDRDAQTVSRLLGFLPILTSFLSTQAAILQPELSPSLSTLVPVVKLALVQMTFEN